MGVKPSSSRVDARGSPRDGVSSSTLQTGASSRSHSATPGSGPAASRYSGNPLRKNGSTATSQALTPQSTAGASGLELASAAASPSQESRQHTPVARIGSNSTAVDTQQSPTPAFGNPLAQSKAKKADSTSKASGASKRVLKATGRPAARRLSSEPRNDSAQPAADRPARPVLHLGAAAGGRRASSGGRVGTPARLDSGRVKSSLELSPKAGGEANGRGGSVTDERPSGGTGATPEKTVLSGGPPASSNADGADAGILTITTPTGLDNWSDSSSSCASAPKVGAKSGFGWGAAGRRGSLPSGEVGGSGTKAGQSQRAGETSAFSGPMDEPEDDNLTPELLPLGAGTLRSFDLNDDDVDDEIRSGGRRAGSGQPGAGARGGSAGTAGTGAGGARSSFLVDALGATQGRRTSTSIVNVGSNSNSGFGDASGGRRSAGRGRSGSAERQRATNRTVAAPSPSATIAMTAAAAAAAKTSPSRSSGSNNGLATFFNRPKECQNCQSSAVAYICDQCTSFYLCENCRFNERVLSQHDRTHRITPLHETHCNTSRTFGGSSSLGTIDGGSSLFYDPCSSCARAIDDTEPVFRCETCDYILCEACHDAPGTPKHEHELRRFQRRARNSSVTEGMLVSKSRTNDGNKIINDYVVVRLLGQGSYAKVKLVQNIRTRQLFALKILRKSRRSQTNLLNRSKSRMNDDDLLREIAVMKFVDHPNVVKLTEVIDDMEAGKLYVIMEYCAKGPVHVLDADPLPLPVMRRYAVDILAGLLHLHSEFLYHRDVKPANCLVDEKGVVKIADFGTCSSRIRTNLAEGTPAFSSPEQVRGEEVSGDVVDSWAFALTIYEMAYGCIPCGEKTSYQYREFLLSAEPILPPPNRKTKDAELEDLLRCMLAKEVKGRMLLGAAAHHPFFKLDNATIEQLCRPSAAETSLEEIHTPRTPSRALAGADHTAAPRAASPSKAGAGAARGMGRARRGSTDSGEAGVSPVRGGAARHGAHPADASKMTARVGPSTAGNGPRSNSSSSLTSGNGQPSSMLVGSNHSVKSGTAGAERRGSGSATAGKQRFSHLYERALQEVRRGKNLTEAFYGVKSIRRVRRKDAKNATHDIGGGGDSAGTEGSMVNLGSMSWDDVAQEGAGAPPLVATTVSGRYLQSAAGPLPMRRGPAYSNSNSFSSGIPDGDGRATDAGGASAPAHQPVQTRLSQSTPSDAALDLAIIQEQVAQQKVSKCATLELTHLRMRSTPTLLNDVADFTTNLCFSHNSLLSVATIQFRHFALLKDIAITSNQLRRFPEEVLQAPRLLRLDLSHNGIAVIPPSVAKAKFLERLNLHSNNIKQVGIDSATGTSVLAAPSLRHVRLSANPLQSLPLSLDSTQGIELVLDANPALMKEWYDVVSGVTARGAAPPAVVIWDDYFPSRIQTTPYAVWISSGDLALYRAHTIKACAAPYVVLLSSADPRFPLGGIFTGQQLTAYFDAVAANTDGPSSSSNTSSAVNSPVKRRSSAGSAGNGANGKYSIPQPPPRPLPPVVSREGRAYVKKYFFVSDDVEDEQGGYLPLLDFITGTLLRQDTWNGESKGSPAGSPFTRNTTTMTVTSTDDDGVTLVAQPTSAGCGLLVMLLSSQSSKEAWEATVAALSDALCKLSPDCGEDPLKVQFEAIMAATRSLYA